MDQPIPDDKNWTWVLERPCPECGYDASTIERSSIAGRIRTSAGQWRRVLAKGDIIHRRPPTTPERGPIWSVLEYGAHVRDVYEVFAERFERMLTEDDPAFANWDQDRTATEKQYHLADPQQVGYRLAANAGLVADMLDRVGRKEWQRTGRRSEGSNFTVESLAYYLLHDPVHHLWDAEQGFIAIAEADDPYGEEVELPEGVELPDGVDLDDLLDFDSIDFDDDDD